MNISRFGVLTILVLMSSVGAAHAQSASPAVTATGINGSGSFGMNTTSFNNRFGHSMSTNSTAGEQHNFGFSGAIALPQAFSFGANGAAHNDTAASFDGTAASSNSNFGNSAWGQSPKGFEVTDGQIASFASGSASNFATNQITGFHSDTKFSGTMPNKFSGFNQGTAVTTAQQQALAAATAVQQQVTDINKTSAGAIANLRPQIDALNTTVSGQNTTNTTDALNAASQQAATAGTAFDNTTSATNAAN